MLGRIFFRSKPAPNGRLGEIDNRAERGVGSGQVPHRPRERQMAIDWPRFGDDDYYASVCTTLYETH
jgi:hypothetical protein